MKTIGQLIAILILGALGYFGWENREMLPFFGSDVESNSPQKRTARAVPVIGTQILLKDLKQIVTAVGTLQANRSIDVTVKVTAKIDLR